MAITYHAGRRIQGLERTGSTPTKEFNFSSSTGWVSGNSTYFYISSDKLNVKSDTDSIQTNMTYDLLANDSITVGTSWVMTFTLDIASPYAVNTNSGNQHRCYIGLASATTVGEPANIDEVDFTICPRSDVNAHESFNNNNTTAQYVGTGVTVTSGTKYIKLIRDGNTSFKTYIYNNADYSDTPTITEASNNLSNITGTKYIKVSQYVESNSGTLNFTIDDLKFYNGVTSVVASAGDVKPTNVQVGSRWEETDTRKMYYRTAESTTTEENIFNSSLTTSGNASQTTSTDPTGKVVLTQSGGSGNQAKAYRTLSSTSSSLKNFTIDFTFKRNTGDLGNNSVILFCSDGIGTSTNPTADLTGSNKRLFFAFENASYIRVRAETVETDNTFTDTTYQAVNTTKYYRFVGNGSTIVLTMYPTLSDRTNGTNADRTYQSLTFPSDWTTTDPIDTFTLYGYSGYHTGNWEVSDVEMSFTSPSAWEELGT